MIERGDDRDMLAHGSCPLWQRRHLYMVGTLNIHDLRLPWMLWITVDSTNQKKGMWGGCNWLFLILITIALERAEHHSK